MMARTMLVVALGAALISTAASAAAAPRIGEPAPDFSVRTLDGEQITLANLRGEVVLLNIWATWCAPCRTEMPLLSAYHQLAKDKGLRVLAVTTEDSAPASKLRAVAAVLSFPLARWKKGRYAVLGGVPTSYIIDRRGVLRYAKAAAFTLDDLNRLLVPLLNEPPPPTLASISAGSSR